MPDYGFRWNGEGTKVETVSGVLDYGFRRNDFQGKRFFSNYVLLALTGSRRLYNPLKQVLFPEFTVRGRVNAEEVVSRSLYLTKHFDRSKQPRATLSAALTGMTGNGFASRNGSFFPGTNNRVNRIFCPCYLGKVYIPVPPEVVRVLSEKRH